MGSRKRDQGLLQGAGPKKLQNEAAGAEQEARFMQRTQQLPASMGGFIFQNLKSTVLTEGHLHKSIVTVTRALSSFFFVVFLFFTVTSARTEVSKSLKNPFNHFHLINK